MSIPHIPPPWHLTGTIYLFCPPTLTPGLSMIQILRFPSSPVGPYDEMLVVPGLTPWSFHDATGKIHRGNNPRITEMYVSQKHTCYNGRISRFLPSSLSPITLLNPSLSSNHALTKQTGTVPNKSPTSPSQTTPTAQPPSKSPLPNPSSAQHSPLSPTSHPSPSPPAGPDISDSKQHSFNHHYQPETLTSYRARSVGCLLRRSSILEIVWWGGLMSPKTQIQLKQTKIIPHRLLGSGSLG